MDTIYALASARGKAGVSVVRISGPLAFFCVKKLAGCIPKPRISSLRTLKDSNGDLLDEALLLCFEKGASFTGEQSAELHLHGSVAIVKAVFKELSQISGLRYAEAGEFTRRALENGCLDLTQVEGLADLIESETEAQRRQAIRVLSGAIGEKAAKWRVKLIRAAALLEATIDFADEEVPVDVSPEVLELLSGVMLDLEAEISGVKISERIRDGFEVAIVGRPNVGKSTLLNTLAGREAAITSEIAGTTRDVIEVRMDISGLAVTLLDTAGLRETDDIVEAAGVSLAKKRSSDADLRLLMIEHEDDKPEISASEGDIFLIGKDDEGLSKYFSVSGKTGYGIDSLIEKISSVLLERAAGSSTAIRERHKVSMTLALGALETAVSEVMLGSDRSELAAEDMRTAIRSLDVLVGKIDVENLLDEIFTSFCIGK
jgi:tRNA modification GTPase